MADSIEIVPLLLQACIVAAFYTKKQFVIAALY